MKNFKELGLNPELIQAVTEMGFEQASEIQEKTIPVLIEDDTDLIGLAQTGTGKTAAFGLPLLQKLNPDSRATQGLILSPTRELCLQITNELQNYAKHLNHVNIVAIYGGASISEQEKKIKRGAQIIVATPGRMKDMLQRRIIKIDQIKYCVLDEADEMLNMGFYEDITDILKYSPAEKNTWLFSATMPKEVSSIAKKFMSNPFEITVGNKNEGTKNVHHEYYVVGARDRYRALKRLVDANPDIFSVIFCRTKRDTQNVAEKLSEEGYNAAALHGDLSQSQRDLVMKSFRNQQIQLLVATDVAARGIDVDDISHVINYQLPDETEIYTHRSGRTGRAGKQGISMVIITKSELRKIHRIESIINQKFEHKELPKGEDICKVQLFHLANKIKETPVDSAIEEYIPELEKNFSDLSKEEFIKKVFSVEFSRFYNYYKDEKEINIADAGSGSRGNSGQTRFFINIGEREGLQWQDLKDLLRDILKMDRDEISGVEVKRNFSFFNTDVAEEQKVLDFFRDFHLDGRKVEVEITKNQGGSGGRSRDRKKGPRKGGHGGGGKRRSKDFKAQSPKNKGFQGSRRSNIKKSINRRKNKNK